MTALAFASGATGQPTFGQTSGLGVAAKPAQPAFGQMGAASAPSQPFGLTSGLGEKPAQPAFGSTSGPGVAATPAQPAFGQMGGLGATPQNSATPAASANVPASASGAPAGVSGGGAAGENKMPESLKIGAQALGKEGYNKFVVVCKDLKAGTKSLTDAVAAVQALLAGKPDLIEQFKTWGKGFQQPAAGVGGGGGSAAAPGGVQAGAAGVLGATALASQGSKGGVLRRESPPREHVNILSDFLLKSQPIKGGMSSALAHQQAFPHASRAFSYLIQTLPQSAVKTPGPAPSATQPEKSGGGGGHAFASARNTPDTSVRGRASAPRRGSGAVPLGQWPLAYPAASTPSTPDLPIKVGAGLLMPLRLDAAIRELDKELSRHVNSHDVTPLHKSISSDQPDPQTPTPRSAHREGESLEHPDECPAHEEEWKSPPIKASDKFHTHVVLCNEGGQEKARKEYYAARMQRARKSGSALSRLKQDADTMARGLADLKKRLDGETARVGASKACEDQDVLRRALLSFDEIEGELAKARQPLGRCWALLEFGNVADVMIPEVHAAREDVGRQQQLARTLSADIAAKRREYKEQTTELQRVSKLRECHQPWYMALEASKCITKLIDFRRLQATKEACERQGEVSRSVWQESDPAKFKSSLNLAADGWEQRLVEFAKKLHTFDGHLSEVPQVYHYQLRHKLLKKYSL
jgi:hypothetical protein